MHELVIASQRVVLPDGVRPGRIGVSKGRIESLDAQAGAAEIDVGSDVLMPGLVDSHVHINEPGRTEWEGFTTATQAAAAGGITTVVDMPLNCIPATVNRAAAETKLAALQPFVDVAFWGGVIPGNTNALAGLQAFGVRGCKCFLVPSGVDDFPNVDEAALRQAMPVLRDLGLPLLVHAELQGPIDRAEQSLAGEDARRYQTYLRSRPPEAEDEAIAMMIRLCREYKTRVHIVHLSSASALPLLAAAQKEGLPISAETCLHYLTFAAEEVPDGATQYKCAPPIRDANNRDKLWRGLEAGTISMVVSDHSPCTPALKGDGDFMHAWGGIASLQLGLSALWTVASARGHSVNHLAKWSSLAPAKLAGLETSKGSIAVGKDADFVVFDPDAEAKVERLRHRHQVSPYIGRTLRGVVKRTILRGQTIFDGTNVQGMHGQFVGNV